MSAHSGTFVLGQSDVFTIIADLLFLYQIINLHGTVPLVVTKNLCSVCSLLYYVTALGFQTKPKLNPTLHKNAVVS